MINNQEIHEVIVDPKYLKLVLKLLKITEENIITMEPQEDKNLRIVYKL